MPKVTGFTILIPSWNNLPYLQLCIEGISKHSSLKHQIVVLVNEGKDGTKEWIKGHIDIASIHFPENVGICIALNEGAKLARHDYLLYMNDDMYPLPGWDMELAGVIEQQDDFHFFLSSTMVEPIDTGNKCVLVADYGTEISNFRKDELVAATQNLNKENWNGATWPPNLLHKDLWEQVGGMSEEFSPGMYSDPDLSMKLWKAGVRRFIGIGASKVYHFGSKSTRRVKKNSGSKTFLKKWGITANTFYKYYLKSGDPYQGPLDNPRIPFTQIIRNKLKRLLS